MFLLDEACCLPRLPPQSPTNGPVVSQKKPRLAGGSGGAPDLSAVGWGGG